MAGLASCVTRARKSVLLIARSGRESEFVTELLKRGAIAHVGADVTAPPPVVCAKCGKGIMVARRGKYGMFLGCSRFSACDGKGKVAG